MSIYRLVAILVVLWPAWAQGEILWQQRFATLGQRFHAQMAATPDDGVLALFQHAPDFIDPPAAVVLRRFEAQGNLRWERPVLTQSPGVPEMHLAAQQVVVFQYQDSGNSVGEALVQQYRLSDGSLAWEQRISATQFHGGLTQNQFALDTQDRVWVPVVRQGALAIHRFTPAGIALKTLAWNAVGATELKVWGISALPDGSMMLVVQYLSGDWQMRLLHFAVSGALLRAEELPFTQPQVLRLAVGTDRLYLAATHSGETELSMVVLSHRAELLWQRLARVPLGSLFLHELVLQQDRPTIFFSIDNAPVFLGSSLASFSRTGTLTDLRFPTTPLSTFWLGAQLAATARGDLLNSNFATENAFELTHWQPQSNACAHANLGVPAEQFVQPLSIIASANGAWYVLGAQGGSAPEDYGMLLWKLGFGQSCEAFRQTGFEERTYFLEAD